MKKVYLLLIILCNQVWSQHNSPINQFVVLERDAQFSNFFKNTTIISPEFNKIIKIDGSIYFSENNGQIVLKPTQNNRIILTPPPINSTRQKMYSRAISNDTLQLSTSKIRKGNAQTNEGGEAHLVLNGYPVPTSKDLNLRLDTNGSYLVKYKIYNVYGFVEREFYFTNQVTRNYAIDVSVLKSQSIYTIEVVYVSPEPLDLNRTYTERRTIIKN